MFSVQQKRDIADAVQKVLRATNHPELPAGEISFHLHVDGAESRSWADIRNNAAVTNPGVNPWNEMQASAPPAVMTLTAEQWAKFLDALDNPPEPNDALRKLMSPPPAVPVGEPMPAIQVGDALTVEDDIGQRYEHRVETEADAKVPDGYRAVSLKRVIWRRPTGER